jgi:hypothetical protein
MAISVAAELGIADALASGPRSSAELARTPVSVVEGVPA